MARSNQRFLQPKMLMQMGTMELRARTVVEGFMSGLHRSPFRGMSIEFAEYRHYQPGDEPSRIDWKVFARNERYYIRQYEDETNLDAMLILDASASMGFGTGAWTKWQFGGTLAACLAFLLQRQNDAVGLTIMDETARVEMPAKATRGHLMELIGRMEQAQPSRRTRLGRLLNRVAAKLKRRGMIIVISDLLDEPEAVVNGLRHLQFGGNDVIVFQTMDPAELFFQFEGPMIFIEPETGQQAPAMAEDVRASYKEAMARFLDHYASELGRANIAHQVVDISQPLDAVLLSFLARHGKSR